jgi:Cu/Ag efflux pump CusA
MKIKDNVRILEQDINREDFTQHGLHLNATGKDKAVKLMAQNISQLFEVKKKHRIILKWRTTHRDPCLVINAHNVTNEDHEVIDNKERKEDQTDSNKQGIRISSRPKRIPNSRSDDFLWV